MESRKVFVVFVSTILLVQDFASAGLLQSIRDAAFLKDEDATVGRSNLGVAPLFATDPEPSFFEKYYPSVLPADRSSSSSTPSLPPPCPPGDFLCLAQRNMKHTLGSEMTNAIVKSVATLMTEMLNTTISRSLDIVRQAQGSHDVQKEAEARAAMNAVGTALSTVSSKVIQGVASFVKVSLSGAMWDLFGNVMKAATGGGGVGMGGGSVRALGDVSTKAHAQQVPVFVQDPKPVGPMSDPVLITPSNLYIPSQDGNEIKRRAGLGGGQGDE